MEHAPGTFEVERGAQGVYEHLCPSKGCSQRRGQWIKTLHHLQGLQRPLGEPLSIGTDQEGLEDYEDSRGSLESKGRATGHEGTGAGLWADDGAKRLEDPGADDNPWNGGKLSPDDGGHAEGKSNDDPRVSTEDNFGTQELYLEQEKRQSMEMQAMLRKEMEEQKIEAREKQKQQEVMIQSLVMRQEKTTMVEQGTRAPNS